MAKHLLDSVDVGAVLNKVGSEGMAESVRSDILLNPGIFSVTFQQFPETLTTHRTTLTVWEQISTVITNERWTGGPEITLEALPGSISEGNHTIVGGTADISQRQIDIGYFKTDQLTDTNTCCIQKLQHGSVAHTFRGVFSWLVHQPIQLLYRKNHRCFLFHLWWMQLFGRIFFNLSYTKQIVKKSMKRCHISGHCGRCKLSLFQI